MSLKRALVRLREAAQDAHVSVRTDFAPLKALDL
jgi:hypothetical protein